MRELIVISMGGCRYGVWKDAVLSNRRIQGIHWLPLSPECFSGVTEVDGHTATLFDLAVCLGHGPFDRRASGEAIILSEAPSPGGFAFSEESNTIEVDPNALLPMPGFLKSEEFEGCAVHAGEPVIVLNIALVYERALGPDWKSARFNPADAASPLELSGVVDVRVFEASGETFAVPALMVEEEAARPGPIRPLPLAPPHVEGLCLHGGRTRAVVNLARRMGLEDENGGLLLFAREGDFAFLAGSDAGRVRLESRPLPMPPLARTDSAPFAVARGEEIIPLINVPALVGTGGDLDLRGAYRPRSKFASLFGRREVKVCEFSAAGLTLVIPDSQVEEVTGLKSMRRMENLHPMMRGVSLHDGKVLPVLDLAMCFGRRTGAGPASKMVYLRNGSFEALLIAESVTRRRVLSAREQRELPLNLPRQYVYGCYTDENEVRLILNVEALAVHFDREVVSDYFETIARETEPPVADISKVDISQRIAKEDFERKRQTSEPSEEEAVSTGTHSAPGDILETAGASIPTPVPSVSASFQEAQEAAERQKSGQYPDENLSLNENGRVSGPTGGSRAEASASGGGESGEGLLLTESKAIGMPWEKHETKEHDTGSMDVNPPHGEREFERVPVENRDNPLYSPGKAYSEPQAPGTAREAALRSTENDSPATRAKESILNDVAGFKDMTGSGEIDGGLMDQSLSLSSTRLSGEPGRRPSLRWAVYALVILASVLASYLAFMLAPGGDGMRGAAERQAKADTAAQAPAIPPPIEDAPHDAQAGSGDREKGPPAGEAALSAMARTKAPAGEAAMEASLTEAENKARKGRASSKGKEASASSADGHTPLEGVVARSEKEVPSASGARTGKDGDITVIVIRPVRKADDSARRSPDAPYDNSGLYEVKRGDTLWHIAMRFTGDPFNYPRIAHENEIPNPDLIFPGQLFTVSVIYGEEEGKGAE